MSKLFRTIGVGANQQTEEVTNEKIRYYKSESDLDSDLANISDDEVIFTQEGNDDRCGISLGMVVGIRSNIVPQGFLPCNGVAFDEHQYPALYALLGDNHTPYSYDKSRLGEWESVTISTSSASPTVMPFDGVIATECIIASDSGINIYINGKLFPTNKNSQSGTFTVTATIPVKKGDEVYYTSTAGVYGSAVLTTKVAYYTHFNVIKATSGLTTEQQDYVLQSLLEADSYSTDEVATGKKWIDGKTIYRKVIQGTFANGTVLLRNVDMMTFCYGLTGGDMLPKEGTGFFYKVRLDATNHTIYVDASSTVDYMVIVEYTKN